MFLCGACMKAQAKEATSCMKLVTPTQESLFFFFFFFGRELIELVERFPYLC